MGTVDIEGIAADFLSVKFRDQPKHYLTEFVGRVGRVDACLIAACATIDYLRGQIVQMQAEVDALQAERDDVQAIRTELSSELERVKAITYTGTYQRGSSYQAGNFATHNGSLWACHCDTTDAPGSSTDWQLCCKSPQR